MGCVPGAFDLVFTWRNDDGTFGSGWIELKKPAGGHRLVKVDDKLRSRKSPAGRLREDQERFRDWLDQEGVPRAICRSLEEVKAALVEWGALAP